MITEVLNGELSRTGVVMRTNSAEVARLDRSSADAAAIDVTLTSGRRSVASTASSSLWGVIR